MFTRYSSPPAACPSAALPHLLPRPVVLLGKVLALLGVAGLATTALAATLPIIPLPVTMNPRPGVFTLCPSLPVPGAPVRATTQILVDNASRETGQYLAMMLYRSTGCQFTVATNGAAGPIRNAILLTTVNALSSLGAEGYELTVAPDSVVIRAPGQGGVFYGVQSLLQLLPPQILSLQPVTGVAWTAPCVYIQDKPRFAWRGMMLDVSRHFVDKVEVERILDGLALHKINIFHWHLTDDHGWRIEIKAYPLLTATASTNTAAWRTGIDYALNPAASTAWNAYGKYGGYYTQDDIREVVAYAQQRHITIVPEIEFPAHCTAALVSYPNLGCGNPGTTTYYDMDNIHYGYTLFSLANSGTFFTNVLTEVMSLFPGPYIHTGGDEVIATGDTQWTTYGPDASLMTSLGISPSGGQTSRRAYQYWLSTNLTSFLQSQGRTMCGWSEMEDYQIVTNAVLLEWTTDKGNQAASNGQYVVMCPNGINYYQEQNAYALTNEPYFQVGQSPSYKTMSAVYNYEPVPSSLNAAYAKYILGAQLNLWTEFVPSGLNMEYKIFPRMCAESEVAWTPAAQKNYTDFTARLVAGQQRLAAMGLNYNSETNTLIGTWGPTVPTSPTTLSWDITPYVTKRGDINVSFVYTTGSDAIDIYWVRLLENGKVIDTNTFTSFAGSPTTVYLQTGNKLAGAGGIPCYVVRLPVFHPGSTYAIEASVTDHGGLQNSSGKVFLPNWN